MTSISSTDFDALDNRSHLGRAYHSGPIVFNSEKKDTREGLSGECLTKSAISFDDSTKQKSLPFDVNLSSFSGHASQDFDDLSSLSDNASQDFDDFDFVGFDYGAGMLPNLKDELDSSREKPLVDFDAPNIKAHGLLVSNSEDKYTREASARSCMTPSVCSLVDSMPCISSPDFDALDNRSHLGRAYQSSPIVFNSEQKELQYRTSLHLPNKPEKNHEEEKMELLKSVIELQDQRNRSGNSQGVGPEVDMCPRSCHQGRRWPQQNRTSRIPFSAEAKMSRYQVDKSCFHCCPHDRMSSAPLRPHLFCNESQYKAHQSPRYSSLYSSTLSSPQYHTSSEFSLQSYDPNSEDRELKKYYRGRNCLKRHVRPVAGGAPFVICYHCSELLQLPLDFLIPKRRFHKLMCSACLNTLKFSLEDGTRLLPYADDYTPDAVAPPPSEVDDYGRSLGKSCSTEGEPFSAGLPFQALKRDSYGRKLSSGSSFEPMGDSVSSYDGHDDQVPDPYLHRLMELEQPATFAELGMDLDDNKGIIDNLLRFVRDKEIYKNAGKDWKRGYLLYDSPGTDRLSLIAAMANRLEFDIYDLDLTGLTSMSELTNVLVSIRNHSLIAIKDFDHWAGKLPHFKTELTLSGLSKIIHGLLSSCGDEQIIVLTTNHNHIDGVDVALLRPLNIDLYIHTSSPQPKALPDGGEIVLLDSSEQKPSMDFDATNNRAYQSDILVSNSEEKNTRVASRRQCMREGVPSLVDSMELEQPATFGELGMDPDNNKGIISDLLRFIRAKDIYKKAGKDWKRGYLLYDTPGTDRSSLIAAMANRLEFHIDHLDLTGFSSISELRNVLVSIRNRSLIAIIDFDRWAGMLPNLKNELTPSGLSKIIHDLLSSCGDEQIIVLTINHNHIDGVDAFPLRSLYNDLYIHMPSPQPRALLDGGEIVLLDSSEQKPSEDFDATNNRAYQSDVLVSNLEEKNTREASRRQCMPEGVLSLVDSTIRISLTDFHVPDNSAHFVREYQSGPIVFNSEKKDTGKGLNRECLTKSALGLDDSAKPRPLPDFDATENTAVRVYTKRGRGCRHPMGFEQRTTLEELGMDPENEGIISDLLRFVRDKEELYKNAGKDWKRGYLLYDSPGTDRSSLITAMANFLEFDIYHLDLMGLITISELTNVLVSIRNRSLIAIKNFDSWFVMLPNLMNELTLSGLSKIIHGLLLSCGDEQIIILTTNHNHIDRVDVALLRPLNIDLYIHTSSPQLKALPDGGEIMLLDSSEQKPSVYFDATNNGAYQRNVFVSHSEEKSTREASRRQCMPEGVLSLVDSTTRISFMDFDAPDNRAHLLRAYQSDPVVFSSETIDMGERLYRECLTNSALSLDDSKPRSLPDFDATKNKAVKVYTRRGWGFWHSMEELEQRTTLEELRMAPKNEGIISDLLRFVMDKEEFYKKAGKDWKRAYLLYDSPGTDRLSLIAAMANCLEFDIYPLDLTGLTSISELINVLVSIRNGSLIAIKDLDHWAGKLPDFKTVELTLSSLLKIIHGLLSSCGDERIIVLTTNHNHIGSVDVALLRSLNIDLYNHTSSPQPKALADGGEIVLLDPSEQKPSVDFDATNNSAYQSEVLVSNSAEKNTRQASRRQCIPDSVPSLVDSTTRTSLTDFDAPDNSAHLVMAYQSGPIVFNSEKKDMGEVLSRECLNKSALSLDDSSKQKSLSDVAVTGKKTHIVGAYENGPVLSFSDDKNGGEALKRECITKSILGLEDLQQHSGGRGDDAAKSFCAIYDPGIHTADSLARISFKVLETLPTREQPNDCVPLLSLGRLTLEDCVQQEKSPDLPRVTQINGVEQRVTKLPRYFGGLTTQSASSSRWPIGLPDRGYIVLLDLLDQSTKHIEYVARADQCSPTLSLAEKKMVRKTLKRKCRTMSVIFEDNHQHFARRCEGDAKSLGVKRIKNQGIHQWPFFRQKWATRKGYSLGEERPFEVRRLSVDETLDSRLQLIHMSQFARSSPRALALPDGGEIVRPTALSSSEFAATNNRAHLVSQDQSGSTASHYKCKNSRETSDKQGLEDLQQHFGCEYKHALKSLGVSGSMFKTTCKQHWFYWWPGRFENNEQQAFDATSNRAHLVKADERGPTVSNVLFLEDLRHQFGARCKDAVKGLHDSLAWKSFKVQDNLPLGEQSDTRRRSLTHKHCVRLKKSQGLPRSMLRDCAGGLAAKSDIGLPDGGHILSLSEKKIVRKTLKRKCRTMSVLSLEDHQQHVGRRWEDTVKFLGAKRICRQLVIHRETTAKRIRRQLGTRRWLFKQSAVGLPDGGRILYLPEKKIVRKTLKRKCRSISVLSLEDHKQHVDRRWEDAVKSHGAKRICRQLGIHRLSTAKRTHKQHGIHQWPFQRSAIGLPDGRHVLPLSEKKMVRKTLKGKCQSMSVLSLVDCQQHVDRRWEDATKNIGAKRICRQLVIHRVSIAKRICRQHGIHHQWPFERDRGTMKGYTLGDERPVEVIRLSTDGKLVSRLQVIYISWLGRFSPPPSTLPGGEIVGHIVLSSSQFGTTNSIAQRVGQNQSSSASPDSENERTREQENPEEIYTSITKDDLLRRMRRMNREDAAASLSISVATFKRKCREFGIKRWPHVRKRKVGRPPDQHGEGNTSTARETPSHNVQTGMEGEPVGQNQEANVFRRDFTEGPTALNTENGLIIGSSSEWTSQVKYQSTLSTPYPNHDALVFPQPHITSMLSENRGGSIDWRNSLASQAEPFSDRHISGSIWRPPNQLEGQTTQFTAPPNPNAPVFPQFQIASTQVLSENEDRRNSFASQVEAFLMGPVSESRNSAFPAFSDAAAPGQPMATILQTMPMTTHMIPQTGGFSGIFQLEGQLMQSTSHPNLNVVVPQEPQIASTQMLSENMGSLENWEEILSLEEETSLGGHVSGSVNLTGTTCCDPSPSQQPVPTNRDMMPTTHVMSHLVAREDIRSATVKVSYGDRTIKFKVPLTSRIIEVKEEVKKRLRLEPSNFDLEYKDEDDGDWIFLGCDEDLTNHLQLFGNRVIRLLVVDTDASTKNICESCGSLKRKRQF